MEEFLKSQPELTEDQRKSLTDMIDLFHMALYAGDTWSHLSIHHEDVNCEGDQGMNWKERGYSTILDILMVCIFFKYVIKNVLYRFATDTED